MTRAHAASRSRLRHGIRRALRSSTNVFIQSPFITLWGSEHVEAPSVSDLKHELTALTERTKRPLGSAAIMRNKNFNDWAVALIVIACSIMLFLALAFALSGKVLGAPSRPLRVNFHDVTGVTLGSQVKFAGAIAGKVASIRMLTPDERTKSGDPLNAVQLLLAINAGVPPLPSDVSVSIAADTLLSDKFVLVSGGSSQATPLAADAVLQGIPPTTFDKLTREMDGAIESLRGMLSGTKGEAGDIFDQVRRLLSEAQGFLAAAHPVVQDAQSLLTEARPVVQDAKALTTDARQLIVDNKEPISRAIQQLDKSASALGKLASDGSNLVANNEKKLNAVISDFKVTSENLKVTSTYAKILIRSLSQRPSQLIWGTSKPPPLPSEQQILRSSKPLPTN
jgi:ABC-type transporter Mla subunit MlaD